VYERTIEVVAGTE